MVSERILRAFRGSQGGSGTSRSLMDVIEGLYGFQGGFRAFQWGFRRHLSSLRGGSGNSMECQGHFREFHMDSREFRGFMMV